MAIGPTIENLRKKRAEEAVLLEMLYALPTPTGGFDINTPAERRQLAERGLRGGEPYSEAGMDFGRQRPDRGTIDVMPQQPAEFYAREVSRDLFGERATNDLFGYPQGTGNLVGDILTGGGMLGAIGATAPLTAWDAGAAAARGDYGDAALKSVFSLLEGAGLAELATGARGIRAVANEFPEAAQEVGQKVRGFLTDEVRPAPAFGKNWTDVYHWSRSPEDFNAFDAEKSVGSTSRLGPHVGTKWAAEDRFKSFEEPVGFTIPLKANLSRPFYDPNTKMPWKELDLEMFISAMADEHGIDRRDVPPMMRRLLAEQGFTNVPYVNDVEDAGSISNIMLTDRGNASDAVLRSRFAKFDPRRATAEDLSAAVAAGLPLGLMAMPTDEERYR